MNAWKVQMRKDIDVSCPLCDLEIPETLMHKFYDCPRAKMAWTWAASIIYILKNPPHMDGNMKRLGVRQCLFNKKIFCRPKGVYASLVPIEGNCCLEPVD